MLKTNQTKRELVAFDPVDNLWDKSLQIKVIYRSKLVDLDKVPAIHNQIIPSMDNKTIDYAIQLEIPSLYEEDNFIFNLKYYRASAHMVNLSRIEDKYNQHIHEKSEFMKALKYIFNFLEVRKFKVQRGTGYAYVDTAEN